MLRRVSAAPRLYVDDTLCDEAEAAALARALAEEPLEPTDHGAWADLPPRPALAGVEARVLAALGAPAEARVVRRLRRYAPGQGHPPHEDRYLLGGLTLYATAMLTLQASEAGGETRFPDAEPQPVHVRSVAGRLTLWLGFTAEGQADPTSRHDAAPVERGEKFTLTFFVYAPLHGAHMEGPAAIRRFAFVDDGVPEPTRRLLREAALDRGLDWRPFDAARYDLDPCRRLRPGDLLYRAAVSSRAGLLTQHIWTEGVRSFYALSPYQLVLNPTWALERAGLPVPLTLPAISAERGRLRVWVDRLGGLPVVVKFNGGEGGVGTLRVDSLAALFSLVDHARSQGLSPALIQYLPDTVHWRVIVVGDRAVASYPNPVPPDDFRSRAPADPAAYRAPPPPKLAALAVAATHTLGARFGGVDLLYRAEDDQAWILEVNTPCYFAHAQDEGGVDVAGAMLEALLAG
jgi:hypothetical protein